MCRDGKIFAIVGPSGVGKDAAITELEKVLPFQVYHPINVTTRPRRPGEAESKKYVFVGDAQFQQMVETNEFIEFNLVHGFRYGTQRQVIEDAIRQNKYTIWRIDPIAATQVKKEMPELVTIYVQYPPGDLLEQMRTRLSKDSSRGPITDAELRARYQTALDEELVKGNLDHIVTNFESRLDETVVQIEQIILAEMAKR